MYGYVDWIYLAHDRAQWSADVEVAVNFQTISGFCRDVISALF